MAESIVEYKSFLLRLWKEGEDDHAWRVSLVPIAGKSEMLHFSDPASFCGYLLSELAEEYRNIQD